LDNSQSIHDSAAALCGAIGRHAQLCEEEPHNRAAIEATATGITEAVTDYAYAVFRKEGLDIFFAAPSEDPEPQGPTDENARAQQAPSADTGDLIIEDRFTIRVEDPGGLAELAESATGLRIQDPADALRALCSKDGWEPMSYPGEMLTVAYHAVESV